MIIEKYTREYENLRDSFKCGNNIIDNFLREGNALNENQGITYVMLSDKRDVIIGYYNIEVGRIDQREEVGNNIFYRPMGGTVNINYLAIHRDFQGIKVATVDDKNIYLGDILLNDCERRILSLRKQVGITFITLYSTNEGYHLYKGRNSYEDFEDDMSTFVQESDQKCFKLYKCIDDIVE
ncbi:MAG: N-acetyltransferase [Dorea sp.]|nr:N-acetyltransferase [Dorea sp.]